MWNNETYLTAIKAAKKAGRFQGEDVKTQEQIYKIIGEKVNAGIHTVISWSRKGSTGPGDNDLIEKVEKLLGLDTDALGRREEKPMKESGKEVEEAEAVEAVRVTEFNKYAIFSCYYKMKEYLHDDEVEFEERFADMCQQIEAYRIAMPEKIYGKIQGCIAELLEPIVYDPMNTFAQCYTDEIGFWKSDGTWQIRDEAGTLKFCTSFLMKLAEIEDKVDAFAKETLNPLLMK